MKYTKAHEYRHLYKTARWLKLRKRQLRVEPLCRFCAAQRRLSLGRVVDHIRPHKGDEALFFDPENLQTLCKPCHDGEKQHMERTGHVLASGADGLPIVATEYWPASEPGPLL